MNGDPRSSERVAVSKVVACVGGAWCALVAMLFLGRYAATATQAGPLLTIVWRGLLPALVAIAVTIACERLLSRRPLGECLAALGLGKLSRGQLIVALLAMAPLVLAYAIIFFVLRVPHEVVQPLGLTILKYAVAQGVAEELLFRGFAFRWLRKGRSFGRAALLSAVVFAIVHVTNLVRGVSAEVVIGMLISTVYAFILAFPFALLFERGRGSLWGVALLHLAIDSNNWFTRLGDDIPGLVVYVLLGAFGALAVATLGARRLSASDSREVG